MHRHLIYLILFIFFISNKSFAEQLTVPILTLPSLELWKENSFVGSTQYSVIKLDNRDALKAVSNNTASGLTKEITVDLNKTPYLNWSWRIENTLKSIDETTRDGDDYPARIYVVISGGLFFWKTRALNYVWSSYQPLHTVWPNAYTDNATLIAIRSGDNKVGEWKTEKRNVLEDIKQHLGLDNTRIDAIAIMTDTDNSHQSATAYYRNIYFSNQ